MVRKSKKKVTSSDTGTPAAVQADGAYQAGDNPSSDAADDAAQHASDQPDELEQNDALADGAYQHGETPYPDASEDNDAEKPADEQPQESGQDVAPADETPENQSDVGDADRGAAEAPAAEHADGPIAEDQQNGAGNVSDGKTGGVDAVAVSDASAVSADTRDPGAGEPAAEADVLVEKCSDVGFSAYYHALSLQQEQYEGGFLGTDQAAVMDRLISEIGDRATVDVLAQQLVIDGLRESAELTAPERIGLTIFSTTLRELRALQAQLARPAQAPVTEPRKVPIDETTMEPTDGLMDAWR